MYVWPESWLDDLVKVRTKPTGKELTMTLRHCISGSEVTNHEHRQLDIKDF